MPMGGRKLTRLAQNDCVRIGNLTIRPFNHFYTFQFANIPTHIITADTLPRHSYYLTCRIGISLYSCFTPSSSVIHCSPTKYCEVPRPRRQKSTALPTFFIL